MREFGSEARLPFFASLHDGDPAALFEDHTRKLKNASVVLIYWGHANDQWYEQKVTELRKYVPKATTPIKRVSSSGEPLSPQKKTVVNSVIDDFDNVIDVVSRDGKIDFDPLVAMLR